MSVLSLIFLAVLLTTCVCCVALSARRIVCQETFLSDIKILGVLLFICILGFSIRLWGEPHRKHIYYDEFTYLSVAQNIAHQGVAGVTLKGDSFYSEVMAESNRPVGYALVAALAYILGRNLNRDVLFLNVFLGTILILVIFRIAWLVFENRVTALWSGIFVMILSPCVAFSACAGADMTAFFFFLLACQFFLEWFRRRERLFLLTAVFLVCYSAYVKPEYGVLALIGTILFLMVISRRKDWQEVVKSDSIFAMICLSLPLLFRSFLMVQQESLHAQSFFWGPHHFLNHLFPNGRYLLGQLPLAMALLAAVFRFSFKNKILLGLWAWFLGGFVLVSGYFFPLKHWPTQERHFLLFLPALILLGSDAIGSFLGKVKYGRVWGVMLFLMIIFYEISSQGMLEKFFFKRAGHESEEILFVNNMTRDETGGFEANGHLGDPLLLTMALPMIPDDAYVLYEQPDFIVTQSSKKALDASLFLNGDRPLKIACFKGFLWPGREGLMEGVLAREYACKTVSMLPVPGRTRPFSVDVCTRRVKG
ncbi:MAG: glycosyltransferase family 39 protein [Candidatus Omnitrophica bacterium]|nr:glycosyltransferase family 39 protein [Candidatus Omnitrophota bacterium]